MNRSVRLPGGARLAGRWRVRLAILALSLVAYGPCSPNPARYSLRQVRQEPAVSVTYPGATLLRRKDIPPRASPWEGTWLGPIIERLFGASVGGDEIVSYHLRELSRLGWTVRTDQRDLFYFEREVRLRKGCLTALVQIYHRRAFISEFPSLEEPAAGYPTLYAMVVAEYPVLDCP